MNQSISEEWKEEWKRRLNDSRITGHISGRHLIQTEEKDNSYGENEYAFLDEWIERAVISQALTAERKELMERIGNRRDNKVFGYKVVISKEPNATEKEKEMFTNGFNEAIDQVIALLEEK